MPNGPLRVSAEGRWQRWNRGSGVILTGISFRDLTSANQDLLWDYVLDVSKELARFLFRHSQVRDIGIDGAMSLAQSSRLLVANAGEFVYQQGGEHKDAPSSIFMLREGTVVLRTRLRGSIERDFAAVRPGDFFGGLPMLAAVEHTESAIARTPCRLVEIDERAYGYLMQARPWVAQKLAFTVVSAYARRMHATLEGLLGEP
jgi:CRP-like cAMP-binding protein